MYRIYIAEDDESIAAAIAWGLSAWDFEVQIGRASCRERV